MFNKNNFCSTRDMAMAKASVSKSAARDAKASAGNLSKGSGGRTKVVKHKVKSGPFVVSKARFDAVMQAAERSGLLSEKSAGSQVGSRHWSSKPSGKRASRPTRT
jgi:hypothetical protein